MPIGTSDGGTFESQWAYAMDALSVRNLANQEPGEDPIGDLAHKTYLESILDDTSNQPMDDTMTNQEFDRQGYTQYQELKSKEKSMENTLRNPWEDQSWEDSLPLDSYRGRDVVKPQNISDVPLDRGNKNNPVIEFGGGRGAGGGGSGPLRSANDNSLSRSGKDLGSYEAVSRDQIFQRFSKNADIRDYDSWKTIAEKENHLVNNKPNAYAAARAASKDGKTSVLLRENGQRTLYHDGGKIVRDRLDHVKNLIEQ